LSVDKTGGPGRTPLALRKFAPGDGPGEAPQEPRPSGPKADEPRWCEIAAPSQSTGEGRLTIDGDDIRDFTRASLRRQIAYVPQEPLLFHTSIAENIAMGTGGAHLRELGLRRWGDPAALARQEAAFLAAYAATAPLPDPARLDILITTSLARHAWISIRSPGRGHVTEAIVARLCDEALDTARDAS
jgi:hypothetical protein